MFASYTPTRVQRRCSSVFLLPSLVFTPSCLALDTQHGGEGVVEAGVLKATVHDTGVSAVEHRTHDILVDLDALLDGDHHCQGTGSTIRSPITPYAIAHE